MPAPETTQKAIDYEKAKPVFELQNYSGYGFSNISLKVYPGEILGLAGVIGAGRTEIATTVFGRDKVLGGKAILDGKDVTGLSTKKVLEAGINYVPEDRHLHGLFKISDVAANTTSAMLGDKSMFKILTLTGIAMDQQFQDFHACGYYRNNLEKSWLCNDLLYHRT